MKNIKAGFLIGVSFLLTIFFGGVIYSALENVWTDGNMLEKNAGNELMASDWNALVSNVEILSTGLQIPSGLVSAFNKTECPSGWKAADGTNGTPDLRGVFIRGLNDFGTGERSDGYQDQDKDINGVNRALGSFQYDTMKPITGYTYAQTSVGIPDTTASHSIGGAFTAGTITPYKVTSHAGTAYQLNFNSALLGDNFDGSDTHPKNIALIYCVKE